MLKSRSFLVFSALIVFCSSAWAQIITAETGEFAEEELKSNPGAASSKLAVEQEKLSSPSVGQKFYEIAYELANSASVMNDAYLVQEKAQQEIHNSQSEIEQAIIFLTATTNLDSKANYVLPILIRCLVNRQSHLDQDEQQDARAELVHQLLMNYVDKSTDLEVTRATVSYLLGRLNSREEREALLEELLKNLDRKNSAVGSELATLLGLLMAEKADTGAAQYYLMKAYNGNKYNKLAFAKLVELVPDQIEPAYLEHLRLVLGENPLDMEAALAFAQYAERLQLYQTAADTYEYCTELFGYLYPYEVLPASLYLPWAISSYNTQRNQQKCLEIAKAIRQSGRFDLLLEAIAAKAAAKIGEPELASRIFQIAEDKAQQLREAGGDKGEVESEIEDAQLAWFYCFVLPAADKALDWANKAYSSDPNSATAAALLAYSLVMNEQTEWAKPLIDSYERNQIADLTLAKIQQHQGQQDSMIESLTSAIARDPGSLVAEHAKEILAEHGQEYIPPIDPDIILAVLRNSFGEVIVPAFIRPEKMISVQLSLRGSKFSYGSEFDGTIAITNNSTEAVVISDEGLFTGNIRVDAAISGDIDKKIPNLVSVKIRPASPVKPGTTLFIPLHLLTAELKAALLTYPQASFDIEFTAYLDPVITDESKLTNRLAGIKPTKMVVKHPGIELTSKYLQNQLNLLTKGQRGQKIKAAQLFVNLLAEQHAMANREPPYRFRSARWLPGMLKSALVHNLTDDDWVVKAQTMAAMLSLPLVDYELTKAVAGNLNDTHWPVRMMAVSVLATSRDRNFDKVLDYTAEHDSNKLVRDMATALGAVVPEAR